MKYGTWSVMTIQEEDGHEFDGIFITCNEKMVSKFSKNLSPLTVCCSQYSSEMEARDFYFDICSGYINIDPKFFIQWKESKKSSSVETV